MSLYPKWMEQLTEWQRDEIELAKYYKLCLGHRTEGHDRLILIATLAQLLDRSTGFSGDASPTGVEHVGRLGDQAQE